MSVTNVVIDTCRYEELNVRSLDSVCTYDTAVPNFLHIHLINTDDRLTIACSRKVSISLPMRSVLVLIRCLQILSITELHSYLVYEKNTQFLL